jgi:hypothetical protein
MGQAAIRETMTLTSGKGQERTFKNSTLKSPVNRRICWCGSGRCVSKFLVAVADETTACFLAAAIPRAFCLWNELYACGFAQT